MLSKEYRAAKKSGLTQGQIRDLEAVWRASIFGRDSMYLDPWLVGQLRGIFGVGTGTDTDQYYWYCAYCKNRKKYLHSIGMEAIDKEHHGRHEELAKQHQAEAHIIMGLFDIDKQDSFTGSDVFNYLHANRYGAYPASVYCRCCNSFRKKEYDERHLAITKAFGVFDQSSFVDFVPVMLGGLNISKPELESLIQSTKKMGDGLIPLYRNLFDEGAMDADVLVEVNTLLPKKQGYREGRLSLARHLRWEKSRDRKLPEDKKDQQLERLGHYECEACGENLSQKYGKLARSAIECHHEETAVADMSEDHITDISHVRLVCASCHRVIHVGDFKVDQLAERMRCHAVR